MSLYTLLYTYFYTFVILSKMSCEGIDLFQIYYKYKGSNYSNIFHTTLDDFRHVDFQHKLQYELLLSGLHKEFTDKELEEKIDNLVDFLNVYGDKIKIDFVVENNLSNTVTRINEILSKTTSNLLYVSIHIEPDRYTVRKKFKFPLRMKLLYIDPYWCDDIIYSKLFIDTDVEEYPCLIFHQPMSSMFPAEKYIDYTKIISLVTKSFISPDCCVNLRNLCIDTKTCYYTTDHMGYNCFKPYTIFRKMECLMLQYSRSCKCDIRQIDYIPYYCFSTNEYDHDIKFKRNTIVKKNNTIVIPYEIEYRQQIPFYLYHDGKDVLTTLRQNRFPHVLRLSKVLPKTLFYSILKLFLQHN